MTPGPLRFEGREVQVLDGDTVASALFRAGVRTFSRSLKAHRRRGLYCGTGECPNCSVTVDGVPGVRSCITPAAAGMRVERGRGWPSAEHDLLHVADLAHPLMPVGFYLKTFIRPRFAWRMAERVIRRGTGSGPLPLDASAPRTVARYARCETIVVGAGIAGLTAALEAAETGERVLLCDEFAIGSRLAPGPTLDAVRALEQRVRATPAIEILERHAALGLFDGPTVPLAASAELVQVRADRVVVATGATESHQLFPGNDLPGCGSAAPPRPWRCCTAFLLAGAWSSSRRRPRAWSTCGRSSRRERGSSPRSCRRPSWTRCRTRPRRSWTASSSRRAATDACAR
jgi:sarcosine oxidase subunit alpha